MTIETLAAVSGALPLTQIGTVSSTAPTTLPAGGDFNSLVQSLQSLNAQMTSNQQAVESLAAGQGDDLHRVMMNLESTRLEFDLALQVRNKVLEAYQEMMRMQI